MKMNWNENEEEKDEDNVRGREGTHPNLKMRKMNKKTMKTLLPMWNFICWIKNLIHLVDVKQPQIQYGWYSGHGGERSSDGFHPGLHLKVSEVETRQMAEDGCFQWADGFYHWIRGKWLSSGKFSLNFPSHSSRTI